MRHLIPYFVPVSLASVFAAVALNVGDAVYYAIKSRPSADLETVVEAALLGSWLTIAVALVFGVVLVVMLPILRAIAGRVGLRTESEQDFVAALPAVLAQGGGEGIRPWVSAGVVLIAGVLVASLAERIVPATGFDNWLLVVAYATWTTAAATLPVVVLRIATRKWKRWAAPPWTMWAILTTWAYFIAAEYWTGAKFFMIWGALPLLLLPAMCTVYCVLQIAPKRVRRAAPLAAAVVAAGALTGLVAYPDRSSAHAYMTSGPIVGSGAWQILAALSDLDGDGATSIIGGSDCDGLDYDRRPSALEVIGNGVDDNCFGADLGEFEPGPAAGPLRSRREARPPIFIITVDTLRADALGRMVDGKAVTPYMDALVEGGVSFTNAYSPAAGTDEAVPALMTGMYPSDWHQYGIYFGVETTLPELMSERDYWVTAAILLPWARAALVHGFEIIDNSLGEVHFRNERRLSSDNTTALALKYLDERDGDEPAFMWVHYFDVHMPRFTLPGFEDWLQAEPYLQNAHLVDRAVGDLLAGLDERGFLDRSVIVLTSDHGEALGEHNLITHGWGVWESIVRVPLAIRLPGVPPREIDERVSLVDVTPTLLEYLGVDDGTRRHGRSLLPLIAGQPFERGPIFIEAEVDERPTFFGVIDDPMKYFVNLRRSAYHLYDLEADPDEARNLIEARPDDAARLRKLLGDWRDRVFNDRNLERKRQLWEARTAWQPEELITDPDTWKQAEQLGE